jgi:hypothetical protein
MGNQPISQFVEYSPIATKAAQREARKSYIKWSNHFLRQLMHDGRLVRETLLPSLFQEHYLISQSPLPPTGMLLLRGLIQRLLDRSAV